MAKPPPAPETAFERSPSHLLHRLLQIALDIYAAETGPGALTQRQYAVLAAVMVKEGGAQSELVRMTGIDRSTLAELVARLTTRGLLARERSAADGRANAVRLTEAGRAVVLAAQPLAAAADDRLLALAPAAKREGLVKLLRDMARAYDKAGAKAAAVGPAESEPAGGKKAKAADKADGRKKKKRKKAAKKAKTAAEAA